MSYAVTVPLKATGLMPPRITWVAVLIGAAPVLGMLAAIFGGPFLFGVGRRFAWFVVLTWAVCWAVLIAETWYVVPERPKGDAVTALPPRRPWYRRKRAWAAVTLWMLAAYPLSFAPAVRVGSRLATGDARNFERVQLIAGLYRPVSMLLLACPRPVRHEAYAAVERGTPEAAGFLCDFDGSAAWFGEGTLVNSGGR